eukprot:CAMPEP_0116575112 /NCGR_PEP_ID=MMETSP0397-20121206/19773_1 /TAXON_ID=216820 /ORGANISM="Cyclophora tenuis, Strain ECT3854" /LENGTH=452 /DNA_ID=CAMNT_0004103961 /DNA_START=83 /DNA_END=1441 /DNA_ORIENTATION=-
MATQAQRKRTVNDATRPRTSRILIDGMDRHEDIISDTNVGDNSGVPGVMIGIGDSPTPAPTPLPAPMPTPTPLPTPSPVDPQSRVDIGDGSSSGFEEDPFDTELALIRHQDDPLDTEGGDPMTPMERHEEDPNEMNVEGVPGLGPPSIIPSEVPSISPSKTPSVSDPPSLVPTAGPSTTPSNTGDTNRPSSSPTTSMPSVMPSSVPTRLPTVFPSMAPSVDCTSNSSGFFGVETENSTIVSYSYEIETTPTTVLADVLGALENAIADSVLSAVLARCTPPNRRLSSRRRLEVVGISPKPDEAPTAEACTVALESANNNCNVVEGALTLYLDGPENGEKDRALSKIQTDMNAGAFNDVAPGIVKITFLDRSTNQGTGVPPEPEPRSRRNDRAGLPIWAYVLIAISLLFLIGVAVFGYRRRANQGYDDESIQGESQMVEEDYQPPDTISALTPP